MQLASIFSDGAVFQRDREIRVFGTGNGEFRAQFLGEERVVSANGTFQVRFSAHPAGGPYEMRFWLNGKESVLRNLMIGEVFILAGQSNAELTVAETYDANTFFPSNDSIRLFSPTRPETDEQLQIVPLCDEFREKWVSLQSEEAPKWPAIALHTARRIAERLSVPVGVVALFKGASVIQSFMSEDANSRFPYEKERMMADHFMNIYPWNSRAFLYHYMVEKVVPYTNGCVVWYQGESNRSEFEASFYDQMLAAMIDEWRSLFQSESLPFVIIQINRYPNDQASSGVLGIMEAQERAAKRIPRCALVKIDDMGEYERIHPMNKREVSERVCSAMEKLTNLPLG